jgi:ketosteroid isomerase-like protein
MADTASRERDLSGIAAARSAWVTAVANGDADALVDLLTSDYEVWANGAPPIVGPENAANAMRAALRRFHVEQSFEPLETIVAGDWAFERGIERMRVTPRDGGPSQTMSQRALLVLQRGADGKWRYARGMTNQLPPGAEP